MTCKNQLSQVSAPLLVSHDHQLRTAKEGERRPFSVAGPNLVVLSHESLWPGDDKTLEAPEVWALRDDSANVNFRAFNELLKDSAEEFQNAAVKAEKKLATPITDPKTGTVLPRKTHCSGSFDLKTAFSFPEQFKVVKPVKKAWIRLQETGE